jgi:hypothetical protein
MTIEQRSPGAVLVAIDIAKDRHEVLIEGPGWRSRKRIRLQNTAEDFRSLAEYLHSLRSPVRIGFEPTGNYHRPLAYFLQSQGFQLHLISSLRWLELVKPCITPGTRTIPRMPKSSFRCSDLGSRSTTTTLWCTN